MSAFHRAQGRALSHRLLIARIAVRMVFQGQLAVRLGDLRLGGGPVDPQGFVVVALVSHRAHGQVRERGLGSQFSSVPHGLGGDWAIGLFDC